jgi:hypothetical protein
MRRAAARKTVSFPMSSTNDVSNSEAASAAPGKSLVPYDPATASAAAKAAREPASMELRRWAVPAFLLMATGAVGWFAGAYSTLPTQAAPAQVEASLADEIKAQAGVIAALEARLKAMETAPTDTATLKPAIEILAQRIDEIARRQTAALTQTSSRLDRSDRDMATRLDRMNERMDRIEKQVSSSVPVGSTPKNVTAVPRAATEPAVVEAKAEDPDAKALRGYVLRDVFRGGALVESRYGLMEVFPGVQLPGAGRVRSVEKRDGRWVVVTTAGLIEARR